ncbi:MAG: DUF2141 domain-containing protein [Myxococcota bacterium]
MTRLGFASTLIAALLPLGASAGDLRVTITGAEANAGSVRAALFASVEAFDGDAPLAGSFRVAGERVEFVFPNIAPGRYGVSSFHDANANEELDRNLVGVPTERFGFSRNARGSFGPPAFDDMAIEVGAEGASITIELR